jgi:hypothetical protein
VIVKQQNCRRSKGGDGQHSLAGVNETDIIADRVFRLLGMVHGADCPPVSDSNKVSFEMGGQPLILTVGRPKESWMLIMRKIILLTIPLIVIIALGGTLLLININQPPVGQDELDRFLQFKSASASGKYEVQVTVKASKPWNFSADMSKVTFGESMYYQTAFRYGEETPDQDTLAIHPGEPPSGGLSPLPFPPEKLWCVFFENNINSENSLPAEETTTLVLIALHQDLYNADIIIHEVAAGSQDQTIDKIVASIGCELP